MIRLNLIFIFILTVKTSPSQCTRQVTHTSGTKYIAGVTVTVTSSGLVDTMTTYCNNTFPYLIGARLPFTSGVGKYTFTFAPPLDSLTLNFSGINGDIDTNAQEVVKLFINSNHFPIPVKGLRNGCDSMAHLTPAGDITGDMNWLSGWDGTTIRDKITTLTVLDTTGDTLGYGGSLFSLFISSPWAEGISHFNRGDIPVILPNPFTNTATITVEDFIHSQIILYNLTGHECLRQTFSHSIELNQDQLFPGTYLYQVINDNGMIRSGKIVKQ